MALRLILLGLVFIHLSRAETLLSVSKNTTSLEINRVDSKLTLTLKKGDVIKLEAQLGTTLTNARISSAKACEKVEKCVDFGSVKLHVIDDLHPVDDGYSLFWETNNLQDTLEDCYHLKENNWFGGPERWNQHWPVEKITLDNFANVPQENQFGAIVEPYWLNSVGGYIFVNKKVPLFINQNTPSTQGKVCFSARLANPYPPGRSRIILHYTVAAAGNAREAHEHAVKNFLGHPSGHPNARIIEQPIWSTWARYKWHVNDSSVRAFAKEIVDNGYPNGQFEIDDDWEICYGALEFTQKKFKDIKNTVKIIKDMNFTVTLWVHPFVNVNCTEYAILGDKYDFFVKDLDGSNLTQWWNTKYHEAHYLDFTKLEVREWFYERLKYIQNTYGVDSFKFDAGETSWAPMVSKLNGDIEDQPGVLTVDYVRVCALLGDLIEIRTGWGTQDLPVFVRMIDKDSRWGSDNGLRTLITTLLQMNLNGYTLVLPDMIGGNGYNNTPPTPELFVRWLQANVFMPSIQFSYVPWDFDDKTEIDVKAISRKMVDLHTLFAPYILHQLNSTVHSGTPVNPPIWWVDPNNTNALKEDTEFLLGEDLLAAPVVVEKAVTRTIVLPAGSWLDGNNGTLYEGPITLKDYSAPIDLLPYFVRKGSWAAELNGAPGSIVLSHLSYIGLIVIALLNNR